MRICIIVPVYNEESVIEENLRTIIQHAEGLPSSATVVAVNDGSRDCTEAALQRLAALHPKERFYYISYPDNRGYGSALKVGSAYAIEQGFDFVVFMDSDLTDHPQYLQQFHEKMCEGWDYIKTTRHTTEGGYRDVPLKRRIISKIGCNLGKLITGLPLTDLANGFRAVRVGVLKQLDLQENGFPIIMEELMKAKLVTDKFCEFSRVQGARGDDARPSAFVYDYKTLWNYFKYLFIR